MNSFMLILVTEGYPKVRKGLLFAQRSPFREKDYPKVRKGIFIYKKMPHLVKKDICFSEKEFVMLDRLKKRFSVEK